LRPTKDQITNAVAALGALSFFPSDAPARAAIMQLIQRMVPTVAQLDWLVSTMLNRVGEWKGPKELRGVFCSRFKPADGIETDCAATVGFTPNELATQAIGGHEDMKLLGAATDPGTRELVRTSVRRMPK
jgi:hypothetical protein